MTNDSRKLATEIAKKRNQTVAQRSTQPGSDTLQEKLSKELAEKMAKRRGQVLEEKNKYQRFGKMTGILLIVFGIIIIAGAAWFLVKRQQRIKAAQIVAIPENEGVDAAVFVREILSTFKKKGMEGVKFYWSSTVSSIDRGLGDSRIQVLEDPDSIKVEEVMANRARNLFNVRCRKPDNSEITFQLEGEGKNLSLIGVE